MHVWLKIVRQFKQRPRKKKKFINDGVFGHFSSRFHQAVRTQVQKLEFGDVQATEEGTLDMTRKFNDGPPEASGQVRLKIKFTALP